MGIKWIGDFDPCLAIKKINETRIIDENNNVKYGGFYINEFEVILHSMLCFPDEITEYETRRLITKTIFNVGKKGEITSEKLLQEINRLLRERLKLTLRRYVLASSISLNRFLELKRFKINNNLIITEKNWPTIFNSESGKLFQNARSNIFSDPPDDYLKIRIHITATSVHDAAVKALSIIDFFRGIWNWAINRGQIFRISWGGKPKPINKIILGPIHTLHYPSGKLASENTWWYEPSYLGQIKPFKPKKQELIALYRAYDFTRKNLYTHKYPNIVKEALIRYTRALDERVWTTAYIKLWSILELLTNTIKSSYEVTVRRASFLYEERNYHYQVLQHLRKYRNSSVHFDTDNSEVETYLYQLKYYVDTLLGFHIGNRFNLDSIKDAGSFLSMPFKKKTIRKRLAMLNKAYKFRTINQ